MSSHRPVISILALGGTIAAVPDAQGRNAIPKLSPTELLAAIPEAQDIADFRFSAFRQSASVDLTPEDIVELALRIESESRTADGIVITQGTDTLEETSFLLDLVLTTEVPVVLTGAMRNAGLPGADGGVNLLAAIQVAADPSSHGRGVLVVFSDEIHLPRYIRKLHTSSTAAFGSPNAGPVGWVSEGRVRIGLVPTHRPRPVELHTLPKDLPTVGIIRVSLGAGPIRPEHVTGFDGLIVEGFGGGHVPASMVDSLASIQQRIPVILASRTGAGELYESTYAYPGSESDLLGRGLISARSLDGAKARLLLILLLAAKRDRAGIARAFQEATTPGLS